MRLSEILERFEAESPISVMARTSLHQILNSDRLDDLFERHAVKQKCGLLAFSTVADLMSLVAIKAKPSINAAYKHRTREKVGVAVASIYNKLQGIDSQVGREMVRETANDFLGVLRSLKKGLPAPVVRGFKTRIIDGNHFGGTEHRIKELRELGAAALPGQCIAILAPDDRLMRDIIPCEDGHASECKMIPDILELVKPGELWIGDRKFGTKTMMLSIAREKRSHFLFRHNLSNVPSWEECSEKSEVGKTEDGILYEQKVGFAFQEQTIQLRRITIKLTKPTRKGDNEIHLLTNLPKRVNARQVAKAYRQRWKIEAAFQQLAVTLNCEIETLGYPKAALFSFCMGLVMFNLLSVIKTAIAAGHGKPELVNEVSTYHLALEISETWQGFRIALTDQEFAKLEGGKRTLAQLATRLKLLGKRVNLEQISKSKRCPKKPPPKRKSGNRGNHVATARILKKRNS